MIGTSLADRYQLTAELGRGGMGVVYLARDPFLQREVAVKVLDVSTISVTTEERFRREAQLVAQMDHPAIVPIYDIGRHRSWLFFVMPVVRGTTLQTLRQEGSLELSEVLEIIAQVAEALDYSHAQGVVHRDIKPENVMVSRPRQGAGEDGESAAERRGRLRVRIMDFGLARGTVSRLTKTGNLPGTLAYLSPEQITGGVIDGRCDLYSLGTILYECLAGEPPFSGSRYSLLYRIAHEQVPPLADRGVDRELEEIVLCCLEKDPRRRPQRGNELAARIRRYRDGLSEPDHPPAAADPSRTGRSEKPAVLPLAGRRRELAELRRRVDAALGGECQLVLIGGEAGMGKTRLLAELEQIARSRGIRVLRGHFSDQESAIPYQGFGELLQDYFRRRETGRESEPALASAVPDLHDLAADLRTLFPVLGEIRAIRTAAVAAGDEKAGPWTAATVPGADRASLYELLAKTFVRLAAGQPIVLLLEHLHGTEASIDALRYVVRRLAATPTLIVGTYRQTEISRRHPLARLIRSSEGDPGFSSLILAPLSASEHRDQLIALLGSPRVTDELTAKLYEASEGNPFFTQELVRSLLEAGDVSRDGTGFWTLSGEASILAESLPETIQQAVESRLERFPEERLRILSLASVLGKDFDYHDLQALVESESGCNPEALDDAVDQLIRDGILGEDVQSRGDYLHFSSGVVRDVLYGNLSRRQRRALHRQHARQLELRYAGRLERIHPRLVQHFAAGDVGAKTVEYAFKMALDSVESLGSEAAIRALRTALEFVEDEEVEGGSGVEGELRLLLAKGLRSVGSIDAALKEAGRAVRALRRAEQPAAVAGAALLAAETAWQGRKVGEARRWVEKGIELARSIPTPAPAGPGSVPEPPGALRTAELSPPETLRRLLTLGATVANLRGEYLKARAYLDEAERLQPAAPAEGEQEPVPSGGTVVAALSNPLMSADPAVALSGEDAEVLANVFDSLFDSDADGKWIPRLGEQWEASADGTRFAVTLRPDVRFSDGTLLSAAEVKRAFEEAARRSRPNLPVALASVAGTDAFLAGEADEIRGIEAPGDHLMSFQLTEPLPIFPALLTDLRTAVARVVGRADGGEELVGTGPFRIAACDRQRVVLESNPNDWRSTPARVERIEFRTDLDASHRAAGLRSGQLDVVRDLLPEDLEALARDPRYRSRLVDATAKNVYFALLSRLGPATRDLAVRQALVGVVDPSELVWRTLGRYAEPATCLLPPAVLGHDPGRRRPSLTPEEAIAKLGAAGIEPPFTLRAVANPVYRDRYAALTEALREAWSAIGAEVEIVNSTMDEYRALRGRCEHNDLLLARWLPDYDDPDAFTYAMLHSGIGLLSGYLASPQADRLLERARHASEPERREGLYRELEDLLASEAVLLALFHDIECRIANPRIRGLRLRPNPPYVNYSQLGKLPDAEPPAEAVVTPRPEATLRVPLPASFDSLDPILAYRVECAEVIPNVFETLTRIDEGARIVPHLASEFAVEEGSQRFRFRLHDNVRFHDGRKLTARDVRYSFERLLCSPDIGGEAALLPIRGVAALRTGEATELEGVRIVSPRELVFDLDQPLSFFPAMLTNPATGIVPEGTDRCAGNWREGCAGTGPFRLVRLRPGERVELEANPHYWRPGLPRCERLVFDFGATPEEVVAEFRDGHLSLAAYLHPEVVREWRRDREHAAGYRESPGFATHFLALNARRDPFVDPAARRALARALDLPALLRSTIEGVGIPADGLIPPGLLGHEPRRRRPAPEGSSSDEDFDFAGRELTAAVLPDYIGALAPFWEGLGQAFRRIGVEIRLVGDTVNEMLTAIRENQIDFIAARWTASYPDTDSFVKLFHSRGLMGELFGDEEIDRLFDKGRSETDPALRHVIYGEIEQAFARKAVVIPLFHQQVYRFAAPHVRGLRLRVGLPEVAYEELSVEP